MSQRKIFNVLIETWH